jgi:serine-type D-Ala-D-Ala carboxypeptidase/endopeptidase (penicillin-binding protein 4)
VVSIRPRSNRIFFAVTTFVTAVVVATVVTSPSPPSIEAAETPIEVQETAPPPRSEEPEPLPEPEPVRIRTCQVDPGVAVADGVDLAGSVALLGSGEVLWEVEAEIPVVPASVLKLVTARAALRVLGPDFRFSTQVVEGREQGEVWLVGGGDPTLTRTLPGTTTYYTDPARLSDLVSEVVEARPDVAAADAFARVGLDSSRYKDFPTWNDTWRPNAAGLGFVAPVTAMMVDGGRLDPAGRLAQRTTDPEGQAGEAFVRQLAEATGFWRTVVVTGVAPGGARVLAEVSSPPLTVLLDQMIRDSDNQIAEALLREVALALGVDSLDEAARQGLADSGADPDAFFADDGSGLSLNNVMTAALATDLLVDLVGDVDALAIVDAFARPGEPGSLQRRFVGLEESWPDISGKTGSLVGVRSLAGVIDGDDPLVYSVFATGPGVDDQTRDVIDRLVAEFRTCGENLAHWVPTEPGE